MTDVDKTWNAARDRIGHRGKIHHKEQCVTRILRKTSGHKKVKLCSLTGGDHTVHTTL